MNNYKTIIIDKSMIKEDNYLQVYNTDWAQASLDMTYSTFKLYLYLASNNSGFIFEPHYKIIKDKIGLSKATYHRAIDQLIEMGYLTRGDDTYIFTTAPEKKSRR